MKFLSVLTFMRYLTTVSCTSDNTLTTAANVPAIPQLHTDDQQLASPSAHLSRLVLASLYIFKTFALASTDPS